MTSITAYEAVQRALRDWLLASPPSLLSGCSVACSHGLPIAAARRDVARQQRVIPLKREGSLVAQAIETPYSAAQPEGQEPGPQDAPALDGACLLQCLYLADRCDRRCEGCSVAAQASGGGAPSHGDAAAASGGLHTPPSNTGVNNEVDEVGNVG